MNFFAKNIESENSSIFKKHWLKNKKCFEFFLSRNSSANLGSMSIIFSAIISCTWEFFSLKNKKSSILSIISSPDNVFSNNDFPVIEFESISKPFSINFRASENLLKSIMTCAFLK